MRIRLEVERNRIVRSSLFRFAVSAVVVAGALSAVCHAQGPEVVFSDSGRTFAVSKDRRVEVRSAATGSLLNVFMPEDEPCQRMWFTAGDTTLLCSSRTGVDEWDFRKARILRSWTDGMESFAGDMAYSRARRMFARLVFSGRIELVRLKSGRSVSLKGKPGENSARLAFSSDGRRLAALYESGTLRIWDTDGAGLVSEFATDVELPLWVSFNGDSKEIVTRTEKRFSRVSTATGRVTHGSESPLPLAYSEDGRLFAYEDSTARQVVVRYISDVGKEVSRTPLRGREVRDGFDYGGAFSVEGAKLAVLPMGSDTLTLIEARRGREIIPTRPSRRQ